MKVETPYVFKCYRTLNLLPPPNRSWDWEEGDDPPFLVSRLLRENPKYLSAEYRRKTNEWGPKQVIKFPRRRRSMDIIDGPTDLVNEKMNIDDFRALQDDQFLEEPVSSRLVSSSETEATADTLLVDEKLEIRFHRTM